MALTKVQDEILALTASTSAILVPKGTTGQRPASPVSGMFRFNTTTVEFEGHNGTEFTSVGVRASNGIFTNSANVSANATIASGDNGGSFGPTTINSGVTLTVSSGSVYTVI